MRNIKKGLLATFVSAVILIWLFISIKSSPTVSLQKRSQFIMDTYCTIQVPGNKDAVPVIEKVFERLREIDIKFNCLTDKSPIYKFNRTNEPVTDEEVVSLARTAMRISMESRSNFDITVYPLLKLWNFYGHSPRLPDRNEIRKSLEAVGYTNLRVSDNSLKKLKQTVGIDLGAIAKGYALGEAVKTLKKYGIKSALVDLGGDIYALGGVNNRPWKIGLRNPRGEGIIGVFEISNQAVVTSGDYERFFYKDGIRYHHILNPKTGYPATSWCSITVVSPDPVLADGWATAFFVMNKEEALKIVNEHAQLETLMINTEGETVCSEGIKNIWTAN